MSEEGSSNKKQQHGSKAKAKATTTTGQQTRRSRPLRFTCPASITAMKHQLVLDAFATVFEQFPRKIAQLAALKSSDECRRDREDILTDVYTTFGTPPSLREIAAEQEKAESVEEKDKQKADGGSKKKTPCCNHNRASGVFLSYDGYIRSNSHLTSLATKLESYYDFYKNWWMQFHNAVELMKPALADQSNLDSDIQDSTLAALFEVNAEISSFVDSVNICKQRFERIIKIQQNPHVEDYRIDLATFERTTWSELCFIAQQLHSFYVLTYDLVVKNRHKLI